MVRVHFLSGLEVERPSLSPRLELGVLRTGCMDDRLAEDVHAHIFPMCNEASQIPENPFVGRLSEIFLERFEIPVR